MLNNVVAPSRLRQGPKRQNYASSASLEGPVVKVTRWPSGYRPRYRWYRVFWPQQGATQGVTIVSVSTPHTWRMYAALFLQTFEWPYFRTGTSKNLRDLAMYQTATRIETGYSTAAWCVVKRTIYQHNRRKTFNNILVQTLTSRALPHKGSCLNKWWGFIGCTDYTLPAPRHWAAQAQWNWVRSKID